MKKVLIFFFSAILFFSGCSEKTDLSVTDSLLKPGDPQMPVGDGGPGYIPSTTFCGTTFTADLFAGQTNDFGSMTVYNDENNLYIAVVLNQDITWDPGTNLHVWAGTDLLNLPKNPQGTPVPGHFPYSYSAAVSPFVIQIPLDDIGLLNSCSTSIYVVLHAVVDGETAFAGTLIGDSGQGRWWYYSRYTIQCCDNPPELDHSATAFAKGGYVFTTDRKSNPENLPSLQLTKNRWGWAINIPADGITNYPLWADAGLNNTSNGTLVGNLQVTKTGTSVTVTYTMDAGYSMSEVHVYAGNLSPSTIAPGQYGNTYYFDPMVNSFTETYTVLDGTAPVWIIAHAVVNW